MVAKAVFPPSGINLCQPHRDSFASAISGRIRLLLPATRVIHVVMAVIAAEGEITIMTADTESTTIQATGPAEKPKPTTKPNAAPRKPRAAPAKAKSGKKTTPAKKGTKGAKA